MTSPMEAIAIALEGVPASGVREVLKDVTVLSVAQLRQLDGQAAALAFLTDVMFELLKDPDQSTLRSAVN